jgi:extradiol dioxygenase family protein
VGENWIDGNIVPLPHFGAILSMDEWDALRERLTPDNVEFVIEPHKRYEGKVNEQASMILRDPSGNAIEFKAFADPENVFER